MSKSFRGKTIEMSQLANIGPQDVPRMSPSNSFRTSPTDPISTVPGMSRSRGRPNLTFKGCPWEVHSGLRQEILGTSPRGPSEYSNLDVQNFFYFFIQNLFDWPNLSKSILTVKVNWEPSQTSKMEHFLQN